MSRDMHVQLGEGASESLETRGDSWKFLAGVCVKYSETETWERKIEA